MKFYRKPTIRPNTSLHVKGIYAKKGPNNKSTSKTDVRMLNKIVHKMHKFLIPSSYSNFFEIY